ncbi:head-tail connector protein [Lacticaseibacillus pabuli]|uniref:Head-tail connector protein n=1 Tax=Lacticaseibacillus pabuli TaxID=3025672 RepID=A0ABY7WPF6_9LACO|nr:head-tail connector protein [Lacticaseibacillus sp. KACC 23028]WDF82068.1 head-tail connector protein [Lacticaseibacillus sp. KACC 23028]
MLTLEQAKTSLRVSQNADDAMIQNFIDTAQEYVIGAVNSAKTIDDFKDNNRFDLAVLLLVGYWYDSRGDNSAPWIPDAALSLIQQIRGDSYGTD